MQYSIVAKLTTTFNSPDTGDVITNVTGSGRSAADGTFRIDIDPPGTINGNIDLVISSPNGTEVDRRSVTTTDIQLPIDIRVTPSPVFTINASDDPTLGQRFRIQGLVVDEKGRSVAGGLPVIIWGEDLDSGDTDTGARPLFVSETQAGGNFSGDWPTVLLKAAFGTVSGSKQIPVALDLDQRLQRKILLVLNLDEIGDISDGDTNCHCSDAPPRAPDPQDLVANPTAFAQDLGAGCMDLTTPNRTLEEFTYSFVVRTSEPNVKGVTLGRRRLVPPGMLTDLLGVSFASAALNARKIAPLQMKHAKLEIDVESARNLVLGDEPPSIAAFEKAAWLSELNATRELIDNSLSRTSGRSVMDADHLPDWDDTPTIFLAIDIAFGHILQFKEVWRADGYSLGDLLYSLPLAPSQRRQVAIVSWDRRTTSSREEKLESEEQLDALLTMDRDVKEIVGSNLHEEVSAGSSNSTWGAAGGIGGGIIGDGFGIFGGIAGGGSGSDTTSWQDSARTFSANSLQSLRDRVGQRASSVRTQRSTVVEALTQQETQRIETETVANYNRCHAITIEYFEVLRHFLITHELASVQECLFVPLPMPAFNNAKALRWQTTLSRYLKDKSLSKGFVAIQRIADNWVGWDFPAARFSEESPESLEGELWISFLLPRPRDSDDGKYQVDRWKPYAPFLPVESMELWQAKINEKAARDRDIAFRNEVAPEIARRLVQQLKFAYVTTGGGEVDVTLDPTLVSKYSENVPLYVSLNPQGSLPTVPRETITHFKVWFEGSDLPPDAKVIVHRGKLRFQTAHYTAFLFSDPRILDDLRGGDTIDPVVIPTPVSHWELRNPREEDRFIAGKLVNHLNAYIEFYHQAIWLNLDAQRRFMLLDSIVLSVEDGRSVASVCTNEIIGIAGNSIILPVAPGQRLNPQINPVDDEGNPIDLVNAYATPSTPALRVSVPTRGVYAEAISGNCNSCEAIDDTRYWRWSTEGQLDIPQIETVSTDSRAKDEPDLTPAPLPTPLVSIQNAPSVPDPFGLSSVFALLSKPELFRDITGLEGTQKNAGAAFKKAMEVASALSEKAFNIAKQQQLGQNAGKMLDRISQAQSDGLLTADAAHALSISTLEGLVGKKPDSDAQSPTKDPAVKGALDSAAQAQSASVKVTSGSHSLEVSFDDGEPKVGSATAFVATGLNISKENFPEHTYVDVPVMVDPMKDINGDQMVDVMEPIPYILDTYSSLDLLVGDLDHSGAIDDPDFILLRQAVTNLKADGHLKDNPADSNKYLVERNLFIAYPTLAGNENVVAGEGALPIVVLVHGNHQATSPSYLGYGYLQKQLAEQGVLSVSVDTNMANLFDSAVSMRAELVLSALDTMSKLNGDKNSRFFGRVDLSKVGMMGHSRGGDAVVRAAIKNGRTLNPKYGIKYLCVLSPTDFSGTMPVASDKYVITDRDAEFFTAVYGSLDGDISGTGGSTALPGTCFRHYDRATVKNKSMVFLENCCHNRFNQVWASDGDDFRLDPADKAGTPPRLLSQADHESLAQEFIGEFMLQLLGPNSYRDFFVGKRSNSGGTNVAMQWSFGSDVARIEDFENPSPIPTRQIFNAFIDPIADIIKAGGTTTPPQTLESETNHETSVLYPDINLAADTIIVDLTLSAPQKDWTVFDALNFRVGSEMYLSGPNTITSGLLPDFTVILTYDDATTEALAALFLKPAYNPLPPFYHKITTGEDCTAMRLDTVHIPIANFDGAKTKKISKISIQVPKAFPTNLFFDSFELIKL